MDKKISILLFIMVLAIPLLCFSQAPTKKIQKMSFDFVDADVRNVLRGLSDVMGKNIIIGDDVKELKDKTITMKLDNVSMQEALDLIIKSKDLAKFEEDNVIRVITLNKLNIEKKREAEEKALIQKEKLEKLKQGEEFSTETIFLNYTTANDVVKVIKGETTGTAVGVGAASGMKGLLSEYGTVTPVTWSNAIIVKDTKNNVENIKKMIKEHDFAPPQVQIEARIVQASSDFSKELGVQWGASYGWTSKELGNKAVEVGASRNYGASSGATAYTSPTGLVGMRTDGATTSNFPYNVNLPAAVGPGSGGTFGIYIGSVFNSFQLDVQLSALESSGKGKIISNPKVITSDNKPAIIKQGQQIPYQTVSMSGTQTELKDAVLMLEVTPQVTKDKNVKLKIKATKDRPLPAVAAGIPIDKKEASTELIVQDGETAVLGGIYEIEEGDSESGVPFLSKIPILGWLFKKEKRTDTKSELLIFVTPKIVKNLYK
ncbi:MAG: Type IV pilus biogenesis and competence protein PilQ precursor [Deltaproteobacteria bacterium ADurb.Bin026]|nr:MAG: Type IV pilus biogenesis and competence protein PilQ precursor [Deltaproteobacteria bacterium ADurb.Bin026]